MTSPTNIYARTKREELQFGPHGTYAMTAHITKSVRKQSERLDHDLDKLKQLVEFEETLDGDEPTGELAEQHQQLLEALDKYRDVIGVDGDAADAIAYILCRAVALGLDDAPEDLALKLYQDYDNDVIGVDQLSAAAELIAKNHKAIEAKNG